MSKEQFFRFIKEENRWELVDEDPSESIPEFHRTFDQKGQIHTSEDTIPILSQAYDLEEELPINDDFLLKGAEARGQELGDASGDNVDRDQPPEQRS